MQPSVLVSVWTMTANVSFSLEECKADAEGGAAGVTVVDTLLGGYKQLSLLLCSPSHPLIFIFKQERLHLSLPCSSATSQAVVTPCFQVSNEYLAFLQTRHFIIQPKPEKSEKQATWDLGKS